MIEGGKKRFVWKREEPPMCVIWESIISKGEHLL